jgi:hypothetical protein
MRNLYIILLIIIVFSCKKNENIPEDNRCANLVNDDLNVQLLSDREMDSIKYIFNKNHLGYENLQFWHYSEDLGFKYVGAYQFVNNLKLFTDYWGFEFDKNDSLLYLGGDSIANFSLTDKPKLSLAQVRWIFMNAVNNDEWYKNNNEIKDSCVIMEFGYYDLNSGSGNQLTNYTTAWYIKPNKKDYPFAFIDDLREQLITYSNGIIINKK